MMKFLTKALMVAACLPLTLASAQLASAQSVGKLAALQTVVSRGGVSVQVNTPVFFGNRFTTNATGVSQFLFTNQTTAKIGNNADIEITRDLVGPLGNTRRTGVRFRRGLGRVIGSNATKTDPMVVATPHMVAGVQGSNVGVQVTGRGSTMALRGGETLVCGNAFGNVVIRQIDLACQSDGGPIQIVRVNQNFNEFLDSSEVISGSLNLTAPQGNSSPDRIIRQPSRSRCGTFGGLAAQDCFAGNQTFPGSSTGANVPRLVQPFNPSTPTDDGNTSAPIGACTTGRGIDPSCDCGNNGGSAGSDTSDSRIDYTDGSWDCSA